MARPRAGLKPLRTHDLVLPVQGNEHDPVQAALAISPFGSTDVAYNQGLLTEAAYVESTPSEASLGLRLARRAKLDRMISDSPS